MKVLPIFLLPFYLASVVVGLGQEKSIAFSSSSGALQLVGDGTSTSLVLSENDWPGVIRAAKDLAADFGRVVGTNLTLSTLNGTSLSGVGSKAIILGTIGNSTLIDSLIQSGKLDVTETKGKWESFQSQIISSPFDGVSEALIIAGSDKRGTIYGIYDISEQIGVSPWYFWADVPSDEHDEIYALNVTKLSGPPSVKYRGLFLNDEQPALTNWINANYPEGEYGPGYNAEFYSLVFELLLRLRANYLWPTMWDSMFNVDDPKNEYTADMYGIVMGTSHTEPMMRATKEQSTFLHGNWAWNTNKANVTEFMRYGAERASPYENMFTMGMRGSGDTASPTLNASSLEDIITVQQEILADVYNTTNISAIPQMWCLYKEVGKYLQQGLSVPDDITMLWADDNWGNNQRLPLDNETDRAGGAGIYYHFDYVGDPRDYKWINTINLQKTWQQMHMAYEKGVQQIWIVNVGDLKALEIPISHFFDLAFDIDTWSSPDSIYSWLSQWAAREFGTDVADATAEVMYNYSILAGRRKYEDIDTSTYSLINYNEADSVLEEWQTMIAKAQTVYDALSSDAQPSFFELVLHPCLAGYVVNYIHINAARNNMYAEQRRTIANTVAKEVLQAFNEDHSLTVRYHSLLNGKWNHMMDQTHLGYDYWQQPMRNTLPGLMWTQTLEMGLAGNLGVSVEGSNGSVPGDSDYNEGLSNFTLVLPPMDPYGPSTRWIDIYSRGTGAFTFTITPVNPWVTVTPTTGTLSASANNTDARVLVSVDWPSAPNGTNICYINVTSSTDYGNFDLPQVNLPINKTAAPETFHGFVESDATVSIEAAHFSQNVSSSNSSYDDSAAHYVTIPGLSRTHSSITLMPETISPQSPPNSPYLSYNLYTFTPCTTANLTLYLTTALNTSPSNPLKYVFSIDDASPTSKSLTTVQYVPTTDLGTLPDGWDDAVVDGVWESTVSLEGMGFGKAGEHVLYLWAMEPGVLFQKIVLDLGGVRDSYMGPPESMRI
ncbi:MAG: hypothetical protein M1834_007427 [Cirrosporium novae-zelandiae]|nr:MAG: hypothetical protein M1834_007427 [Cirrosporium novae-zelandiae]